MTADDAAATGALSGEVDPEDLAPDPFPEPTPDAEDHTPGGDTDPLWYLIAAHLAPHIESTRKRGWIDGFVAGIEAARGIDGEAGVSSVLRASIGLTTEVPVAVRNPSPHRADVESLARFLFNRQAETYEAEPGQADEMWEKDPGVRDFWMAEARAILRFLP